MVFNLNTIDIWGWIILVGARGYPLSPRIFNSILDLYPLDVLSQMSPDVAQCLGQNHPGLETTALEQCFSKAACKKLRRVGWFPIQRFVLDLE